MREDLYEIVFDALSKNNPKPRIELDYRSGYTLMVAVILSAQSTDIGVNKATKALFSVADTPKKMLRLEEEGLKNYIKSIGLYNAKARNILAMSKDLIEKFNNEIPKSLKELESLPGIGAKSARVIANTLFNAKVIAVDTHVFRVSNRIGLCKEKSVKGVQNALETNVPDKYKLLAHHWLVLHGRYICKAVKPKCESCFLRDFCDMYLNKNQ